MVVESVGVRGFRNLVDCEVELGPGLNLLWGANGAGKTNLLEATYTALAGRSCRTRDDRETIVFGGSLARVEATVTGDGLARRFLSSISRADGRRHLVDGTAAGPEAATMRPPLAVFMPDRLALVKGPPAGRRTHLDGFCAALWPSRDEGRRRYSRALAQRNALLGRIRAGAASTGTLDAWDLELATAGIELASVRAEAVDRLAPVFADSSVALGLAAGCLAALSAAQRGHRRHRRSRPRSVSAARPTSLAATAAGVPTTTSSRSSSAAARCGATAPRGSSGRACWPCCSPSAGRCSTTAARRR